MAEKTWNVRHILKGDTYTALTTANPVLKNNEPVVVVVPADTGAVQQEPCILLKIGDGTTAFNDLPFVAGRAAGVGYSAVVQGEISARMSERRAISAANSYQVHTPSHVA